MTKEERAAICKANGMKTKKYNEFFVDENVVHVKCTNTDTVFICDLDVWEKAKQDTWIESKSTHYILTTHGKRFHHLVLPVKDGYVIDHINRNRADNRRSNLRYLSPRANTINSNIRCTNKSGHKGVCKTRNGTWLAYIWLGKQVNLGTYKTYEEACKAREIAEEKYHNPIIDKESC